MFLHRKELIQPVNVGTPNAEFGEFLAVLGCYR